ncbi:hypothetical protein D3C72_2066720 [compost metagenome]
MVQQRHHVLAQALDAERRAAAGGLAMATRIVAHDEKVAGQGIDLAIPHGQVRAQGIRQHQTGIATFAIGAVMQARVARCEKGLHAVSLLSLCP